MVNEVDCDAEEALHAAPRPFRWLAAVMIVMLSSCATVPEKKPAASPLAVVEQYLAALNRRDTLMLTAYVAPDVTWYSVVKGERITEVSGRETLAKTLASYFAQNAHTQWQIEQAVVVGQTVSVRERSQWRATGDGENSSGERVSLAVYEIVDGRIVRISYFLDVS